jgi:hypothetical protein
VAKASEKTQVIDYLWDHLQNEGLGRRVVNSTDVIQAITHCNKVFGLNLSTRNPANFMKDVVRGDNANNFWPPRLTKMRISARQRPGSQRVFEFVDFAPGQTEPFPNKYTARPGVPVVPIEAVSLSLAKRRLGRQDESWLIQVAVELRLIQTHFATRSSLPVDELSHLQTGVKLGASEIDSLFLAHLRDLEGQHKPALVTCEAKQERQRILEHQLVEQVVAASRSVRGAGLRVDMVVPIALKVIPGGRIYFAEFEPWPVEETDLPEDALPDVHLASEAVYELHPPVPGIGHNIKPRRSKEPTSQRSKPSKP